MGIRFSDMTFEFCYVVMYWPLCSKYMPTQQTSMDLFGHPWLANDMKVLVL